MHQNLEQANDEELIALHRADKDPDALSILYRRYYVRVASWCLRFSGHPGQSEELAQEVFTRVHSKLDSFRADSRFSTWLYTVTRSVVINRGISERRRQMTPLDSESVPEPSAPDPAIDDLLVNEESAAVLREALDDIDRTEAQVLYLHYVDGLTLPAITELLGFTNASGAKKYIVNGRRHLRESLARRGVAGAQ
ncbi:MAG: RNA polymerase sigma factor [Thermoanaerobaculia bacterium]|nr:RNA polymerase sigma factor [Thermoanaerobaculia bacterium]